MIVISPICSQKHLRQFFSPVCFCLLDRATMACAAKTVNVKYAITVPLESHNSDVAVRAFVLINIAIENFVP